MKLLSKPCIFTTNHKKKQRLLFSIQSTSPCSSHSFPTLQSFEEKGRMKNKKENGTKFGFCELERKTGNKMKRKSLKKCKSWSLIRVNIYLSICIYQYLTVHLYIQRYTDKKMFTYIDIVNTTLPSRSVSVRDRKKKNWRR